MSNQRRRQHTTPRRMREVLLVLNDNPGNETCLSILHQLFHIPSLIVHYLQGEHISKHYLKQYIRDLRLGATDHISVCRLSDLETIETLLSLSGEIAKPLLLLRQAKTTTQTTQTAKTTISPMYV